MNFLESVSTSALCIGMWRTTLAGVRKLCRTLIIANSAFSACNEYVNGAPIHLVHLCHWLKRWKYEEEEEKVEKEMILGEMRQHTLQGMADALSRKWRKNEMWRRKMSTATFHVLASCFTFLIIFCLVPPARWRSLVLPVACCLCQQSIQSLVCMT